MSRMLAAWNGFFDEPRSLRAVALHRMLVGPIVLVHLMPFFRDALEGHFYGDAFYLPWVSWLPEAPREAYFAMLWLCGLSALTLTVGLLTRVSALYTWAFVAYNLFLSQTHFHHNRAFLLINLSCLALLPCGRLLSIDAWLARRRGRELSERAALWPMYLLRFEAVAVYTASGGSKLLNPDWWSGLVTFDRVTRFRYRLDASVAPRWFIDIITTREFHFAFGKIAVITELFIAIGLLYRPTRRAAIWMAVMFHVSISIGLNVEIFSYLAISALLIWSTPSTRDRALMLDPGHAGARLLQRWVGRLDWLARFELRSARPVVGALAAAGAAAGAVPVSAPVSAPMSVPVSAPVSAAITLIDRDGRELAGAAAVRLVLSRCPLLFVAVAPFNLPGLRSLWDGALRRVF